MDTNYTDTSKWWQTKNINGVWIEGYPWAYAGYFYDYFKSSARTKSYFWPVGFWDFRSYVPADVYATLNNADIVSFDFNPDLLNYRNGSPNANRKHIIWTLRSVQNDSQRYNTQAWAWGIGSSLD